MRRPRQQRLSLRLNPATIPLPRSIVGCQAMFRPAPAPASRAEATLLVGPVLEQRITELERRVAEMSAP